MVVNYCSTASAQAGSVPKLHNEIFLAQGASSSRKSELKAFRCELKSIIHRSPESRGPSIKITRINSCDLKREITRIHSRAPYNSRTKERNAWVRLNSLRLIVIATALFSSSSSLSPLFLFLFLHLHSNVREDTSRVLVCMYLSIRVISIPET